MKGIHAGVDALSLGFARDNGIPIEEAACESAEEFLQWLKAGVYEFAIIDLDAKRFGTFLPRLARNQKIVTPILGIAKKRTDMNWHDLRATFLENGGDDMIMGPANPRELAASIRAITRRYQGSLSDIVTRTYGGATMKMNLSTWSVSINDVDVHLTHKELMILAMLARAPERTQTKEMLLGGLYTNDVDEAEIKIIDVFICKVRRKFAEVHPDAEHLIETVWGRGYIIKQSGAAVPPLIAAE